MSGLRNKLPLFILVLSVLFFLVSAIIKLKGWQGPMFLFGLITCATYLVWLFAEVKVGIVETNRAETKKDNNTCEIYVISRLATLFSALLIETRWESINMVMGVGYVVFVTGIVFRVSAINTLGKHYSHRVRLIDDHQIISQGLYQLVRHPAYTGMLLAHLGFVLVFFNYYALLALALMLLPAVVRRIKTEEVALFELDEYVDYARNRKRLFPGLW